MKHNLKSLSLISFIIAVFTITSIFIYQTYLIPYFHPSPICKNCNVIIVSLDTLSANHLPCYGYARDTSPNLCSFAKKNILFKNAYANSTWTLPSHVSIFTGLYPYTHGVNRTEDILNPKIPFLPEILRAKGYSTIFSMNLNDISMPLKNVYNRGIDKFYDEDQTPWPTTFSDLENNLASGKKTFLFLHTYWVHAPYLIEDEPQLYPADPIPGLPVKYSDFNHISIAYYKYLLTAIPEIFTNNANTYTDPNLKNNYNSIISLINKLLADPEQLKKALEPYNSELSGFNYTYYYANKIDSRNPRDVEFIKALYDQTIHRLDERKLTELFNFLNKKDVRETTIVIITADHGEEFMEHEEIWHTTLYDSNTKVPLIMYLPGNKFPKAISTPVQIADITPTILNLLNIQTSATFQGENLTPLIRNLPFKGRLLIAESEDLIKTFRKNNWKLFLRRDDKGELIPFRLYDTNKDPKELSNIINSHLSIARLMLRDYQKMVQKWNSTIKNF